MIELDFNKGNGLVTTVAQDFKTNEVLMVAYVNEEAWTKTLKTGIAHYWSRSRNQLWQKGESSGNVQKIKEILVDCDQDCLIYKVEQVGGAACHTGHRSCFYRRVDGSNLTEIDGIVVDPKELYRK